jgi:PAS domain-containing protein
MPETKHQPNCLTLQASPILFWRMDLSKQIFSNLNDVGTGGLDNQNYRFFKDRNYRDKLVFPQDLAALNSAITDIKQRLPVNVIFRLLNDTATHWFKLTGWPVDSHRYYEGTVEEISEHIDHLHNIFIKRNRRLYSVDLDAYPVAIFRKSDKHLVRCNSAFSKLTGISPSSRKKYQLESLITAEVKFSILEERLLLEGRLHETLFLTPPGGRKLQALCFLENFDFQRDELIRVSMMEVMTDMAVYPEQTEQKSSTQIDKLCRRFVECHTIDEMLTAIYEQRGLLPGLDAVMYSDIHARKNSVFVHACGSLFTTLEPGCQYPYSGTIAENIEKEKLEYLIVDDTHASIKAIDWALFVPHGVHSYIAKALYVRGAMRTVLIFCSGRKHAFGDHQVGDVTIIATAFHQRLKQLRSH